MSDMKAVVLEEIGSADGLVYKDVPRPQVTPGHVVVKVGAVAVAYRDVIEFDPEYADAYYNLARLLEKSGESKEALRLLSTYRRLTDG